MKIMKKLEALAKGLIKDYQVESRMKRINSAVEMAKLNLEDEINKMKSEYEDLEVLLATDGPIEDTIQRMFKITQGIRKNEKALVDLKAVVSSLNEEVEADKVSK
jgi:hypothetical protein|nr:MAG TPA: hypothetical protein [Bacteriophage sp.]